jgi:hypothetical protein
MMGRTTLTLLHSFVKSYLHFEFIINGNHRKKNVENVTKKLQEIEDDLKLKLAHDIWQNREVEYKEHIASDEIQMRNVTKKNY